MSEAEISSEFEYSASFLRILLPGLTIVTLASYLLILKFPNIFLFFKKSITESVWAVLPIGAIFVTASIIFGLIINILVTPLTRILEGYYLEHNVKDVLQNRQWKKFGESWKNFKSADVGSFERAKAYYYVYSHFSHCLYEMTNNPEIKTNSDKLDDKLKKSILPTKLGNVFRSMEVYPGWKYGLDGVFFWDRIMLLVPDETKQTIDKRFALVDMFIELTWIFFFAAFIYSIVLAYDENHILSTVSFGVFLLLSYFSYTMSVQAALEFGIYVRSTFDLYREELWDKLKNGQFVKLDSLPEKERWDNIFRYLYHYDIIQCEKCGRFYNSREEHTCDSSAHRFFYFLRGLL